MQSRLLWPRRVANDAVRNHRNPHTSAGSLGIAAAPAPPSEYLCDALAQFYNTSEARALEQKIKDAAATIAKIYVATHP